MSNYPMNPCSTIGGANKKTIHIQEVENGWTVSYTDPRNDYIQFVFLDIHTLTEKIKELLQA